MLKTLMICGICWSIYIKVRSQNGNLQADVDIKNKAEKKYTDYNSQDDNRTIYTQKPIAAELTTDDIYIQNSEGQSDDEDGTKTYVDPNLYRQDMNNSVYHNDQQINPNLINSQAGGDLTAHFIAKVSP